MVFIVQYHLQLGNHKFNLKKNAIKKNILKWKCISNLD